ncbi:threonine/serine exporter family protein [Guptibacillus hwajinpoensis]|uniref:Uncharacterized membrane protein YjjB (DUF3815 family) n=1 Tax=Guptibacillus hwajinpoensis TaxID=208199 RepID=A0ABU0K498_9BACL|nr:threonine/serine exporter family protein [Alkalihalobacillus hemicentroti]MDQ0484173.1 uncharacterized membrane protein YjjB (DUF3815 family) [Alkalihalobacillus hemicentroti]
MEIIAQVITSFIASAAFGLMFNAPKSSLIKGGFVGMSGWMIYYCMEASGIDPVVSTVTASFFIAVISQGFAKMYRTPVIIFSVAGIIPLVPGGIAYDAMRNFVQNDYNSAINLAARAFMISGSIAVGLVFSEVINQIIRHSTLTRQQKQ